MKTMLCLIPMFILGCGSGASFGVDSTLTDSGLDANSNQDASTQTTNDAGGNGSIDASLTDVSSSFDAHHCNTPEASSEHEDACSTDEFGKRHCE